MTDWLAIIPQDAESAAGYVEAVRTLYGAGKEGYLAIAKYFGPSFAENLKNVFSRAEEMRGKIPKERHSKPSPAVVIPLLEAAMKESRTELQEKWAALLANATIDGGNKVRREFIEILAKLESQDALVLDIISKRPVPTSSQRRNEVTIYFDEQRRIHGLQGEEWGLILQALTTYRCTIIQFEQLTSFGRLLLAACTVE